MCHGRGRNPLDKQGQLTICSLLITLIARIAGRFCIKTTDVLYFNNTKNTTFLMSLRCKQHIMH